jgi:integrase
MTNRRARANGEGSIFPYRSGYAAYVWVTKPNGSRARKYVYGKTREVVHEKWLKLHQRAAQGPVATRTPTVEEYVGYWLREIVEPNLSPGTYVTYEVVARHYLIPGLGSKRLDRLQTRDVQTWINMVRRTCQCCAQGKDAQRPETKRRCCALGNCCQSRPSVTTVVHIRRVLRTVLSQAVVDGHVARNAAQHVKLPAERGQNRRRAWSSDEARQFLESARTEGDPFYPAYVLILVLGLRKGEVLGLSWNEIDLDVPELRIQWQLQRIGKQIMRREAKTEASEATLPLPDLCVTALREYGGRQSVERDIARAVWQDLDLIFTTRYGTPIEPRNFNRFWARRCAAAGVPYITVHDARRTCGSLQADLDVHPRVAMQILRHAQFSITMEIYTKVSSEKTREALRRLSESLHG